MPGRRSKVGGDMHEASVKPIDANTQLVALTEKSIGCLDRLARLGRVDRLD